MKIKIDRISVNLMQSANAYTNWSPRPQNMLTETATKWFKFTTRCSTIQTSYHHSRLQQGQIIHLQIETQQSELKLLIDIIKVNSYKS
uniref:Uncharacterized protein n=1 Tax=Arundo donax TaxID=35708 RepID=A0A0A9GTH1_ARUDO